MADRNVFGLIEDGQLLTTAPNPHIDLAGTIPADAYIGKLFDDELDSADTVSITVRKDQNNWAIYSGAQFTSGFPDSLDLSVATVVRSAGTINASDFVVVLGLEPIPPDAGDVYFGRKNGLLADIGETYITAVEDDTSPTLGGYLRTGGANAYDIVYTDTLNGIRGLSGTSVDNQIFLAGTDALGNYDPNAGGVFAASGALELHGASVEVTGLKHADAAGYQNLNISPDGVIFGASPPAPGWVETDTSAATVAIPNTSTWTRITGLEITVPQDVAAGDIFESVSKMWMVNANASKECTVALGLGIDSAPPTELGVSASIIGGFAGYLTYGASTTDHLGVTAGQVIAVWMRSTSGTGDISADGSVNNHEFNLSVPAGGGTGEVNTATNLGAGVELAVEINSGQQIPFRTFANTSTVTWTQNADNVTASVPLTDFDARYLQLTSPAGNVVDNGIATEYLDGTGAYSTPAGSVSSIDDLTDVDITGVVDGQILKWATNKFVAAADDTGSGPSALVEQALGSISTTQNVDLDNGTVITFNLTGSCIINFSSTANTNPLDFKAVGTLNSLTPTFQWGAVPIDLPDGYDIAGSTYVEWSFIRTSTGVYMSERKGPAS